MKVKDLIKDDKGAISQHGCTEINRANSKVIKAQLPIIDVSHIHIHISSLILKLIEICNQVYKKPEKVEKVEYVKLFDNIMYTHTVSLKLRTSIVSFSSVSESISDNLIKKKYILFNVERHNPSISLCRRVQKQTELVSAYRSMNRILLNA